MRSRSDAPLRRAMVIGFQTVLLLLSLLETHTIPLPITWIHIGEYLCQGHIIIGWQYGLWTHACLNPGSLSSDRFLHQHQHPLAGCRVYVTDHIIGLPP